MDTQPMRLALTGLLATIAVASTSCTTGSSHTNHPAKTPSLATPAVEPTPAVDGANRDLASTEAVRVLGTIPVPPGSTRSNAVPAPRLRHLRVFNGSVDLSLSRTNWWTVPLSYSDLVAWYDAHTPANIGSAYGPDSTSPVPGGDLYWQTHGTSESYSSPSVVVSYARLGATTTAIRTDVTLAARYDRTAVTLVPAMVTSIDITKSAIDGPATPPATATVADPALLSSVISAFNNLDGAMAHAEPFACGSPVGVVYVYAVTFHWPGHALAVDPGASLCGIGRGLTLDGVKLPQTLADDAALDAALQDALDGS
jgi:hypothetical protein